MKIVDQKVELMSITPNALQLIEKAGRICYKSEDLITDDSAISFAKMIIKRGHEAVIEHAHATLLFVTDRGVSHELVRHRMASFCQESTRYCSYDKDKFGNQISVIMPEEFISNGKNPDEKDPIYQSWRIACETAEKEYFHLLEKDKSPQFARSVLPNSLKTDIIVTANFREWRHIIKLRTSQAAHPQIRLLMKEAHAILKNEIPVIFDELLTEEKI